MTVQSLTDQEVRELFKQESGGYEYPADGDDNGWRVLLAEAGFSPEESRKLRNDPDVADDYAHALWLELVTRLRAKRGQQPVDDYIGPLSPAEWRKRFGNMPETTWRREKKKMRIDEISTKFIRIHRDDVARYEKK